MSEKMSKIEQSAILRKRGLFVAEISKATQPIIERYVGLHNSGTIANEIAHAALTSCKGRIDDAAVKEIIDRLEYLGEIISGVAGEVDVEQFNREI